MATGTSAGSAAPKNSASRAVLRERAEVRATSRDTRATSAKSMPPSCVGPLDPAPRGRIPPLAALILPPGGPIPSLAGQRPDPLNRIGVRVCVRVAGMHYQQTSLFGTGVPGLGDLARASRTHLGRGAWIDTLPGWLSGADELFDRLAGRVPWRAEQRRMYDNVVAVPRLLCHYGPGEPLPHPVLDAARDRLGAHYAAELGEPFVSAGLCYYRDGRDSVAWHGDRIGRGDHQDTMVAIVSLGEPRPLLLRPRGGGGAALRWWLGHGDLIVMGGSCQRTWDHAVPKTRADVGGRISVQFRPRGVA